MKERRMKMRSKRIKLFGDIAKSGADPIPVSTSTRPKSNTTGRILVCQDCGFQEEDPGTGSTREYCPRCGSARFNYLETMPDYGKPGSIGPCCCETCETDKEFSETKPRKSLFSKGTRKRRSLFSSLTHIQPNTTGEGTDNGFGRHTSFRCTDCGHEFIVSGDVYSRPRCPNCGGNRVVRVSQEYTYSDSTDSTGEFLKKASGTTMSQEEATKLFSECGAKGSLQDLIDSGYATITENNEVTFSDTADSEYSLFSKLVISVTRELDLDPVTPENKEDLIQSLEGGSIPPKGIILIKKAHGLIPHATDEGIMCCNDPESYLTDSGISNDLKIEHGGKTLSLDQFLSLIRSRYNDAPENLLDLLCKKGIVTISGSQVAIR